MLWLLRGKLSHTIRRVWKVLKSISTFIWVLLDTFLVVISYPCSCLSSCSGIILARIPSLNHVFIAVKPNGLTEFWSSLSVRVISSWNMSGGGHWVGECSCWGSNEILRIGGGTGTGTGRLKDVHGIYVFDFDSECLIPIKKPWNQETWIGYFIQMYWKSLKQFQFRNGWWIFTGVFIMQSLLKVLAS